MKSIVGPTIISILLTLPTAASAGVWDYVKEYQLGFDYALSVDKVDATYDTEDTGANRPESCEKNEENTGKMSCTVQMEGGRSNGYVRGWGIFLQPAFKRQGDIYFNWDIGFGARYLSGEMTDEQVGKQETAGLPLEQMSFSMASLLIKPYVQFGVTPAKKWPDILVSLGPAAQILVGKVKVNDQEENAAMAATSSGVINGFFELEIVVWRFGDGALSFFATNDVVDNNQGSEFFRDEVDGMDNFRANFARNTSGGFFGLGMKVLLNWP
jgi:hypothetical protein